MAANSDPSLHPLQTRPPVSHGGTMSSSYRSSTIGVTSSSSLSASSGWESLSSLTNTSLSSWLSSMRTFFSIFSASMVGFILRHLPLSLEFRPPASSAGGPMPPRTPHGVLASVSLFNFLA